MRTFYGGSTRPWSPGGSATWPLAELLIDETRVKVRLRSSWMRRLLAGPMSEFDAPLDAVRVQPYGRYVLTRGVLLTDPNDRSVIFWCGKHRQSWILDTLSGNALPPAIRGHC
jgi:hypothetical protein